MCSLSMEPMDNSGHFERNVSVAIQHDLVTVLNHFYTQ